MRPSSVWHDPETGRLRRIAVAAVISPVLFIAGMAVVRRHVVNEFWPGHAPVLIDILTAAAATIFGMTMVTVVRRERRRLLDQTRYVAIVEERERIARELHDSLAQVLGTAHLRLRALSATADVPAGGTAATEIDGLAELCQEAYRDVREAIVGLRETPRADRGLLESLTRYVASYSHQAGLPATLASDLARDPALSPHSEVQVIRVVQEALTNIRKHSGASRAVVRVSEYDDEIRVDIEDDGRGIAATGGTIPWDGEGYGLRSMRERAELTGGRLTVVSTAGRGTRVTMFVPRSRGRTVTEGVPVPEVSAR